MTRSRLAVVLIAVTILLLLPPRSAFAGPGPGDGSELIMADWLFFSFLAFFGAGVAAFVFAWRGGLLKDPENAKYYILTIDEPDYYTPEWAREEEAQPVPPQAGPATKRTTPVNGTRKEAT